jgi:hypothetical protein
MYVHTGFTPHFPFLLPNLHINIIRVVRGAQQESFEQIYNMLELVARRLLDYHMHQCTERHSARSYTV